MTVEKAIEILSDVGDINRCCAEDAEALDMAIKALEQQPCEDCISRQRVLDIINFEYKWLLDAKVYDICTSIAFSAIMSKISEMPSVTPTRPTGRWIPRTEKLPKDGDTYLVTIEYNGKVIGVDAASYSPVEGYIDKHWDTFNDWKEDEDSCYHVLAWMPLPKPYKAESEE